MAPVAVSKRVKYSVENVYNALPLRVEKVLEYFSLFTITARPIRSSSINACSLISVGNFHS